MTPRTLCLTLLLLMIAGCTQDPALPAPGQAPKAPGPAQDYPPASDVGPGPARRADDRAHAALLPVDWDGGFGPEVATPYGGAGSGPSDAREFDTTGSLALSGEVTLTWLATSPTDRELYVRVAQVGCTTDPCAEPSVMAQGTSPLSLAFSFGNGSGSLRFEVGSAGMAEVQGSTWQDFHLDGLVRSTRSGSPPVGTMVARAQESWVGTEEITTAGPGCGQAVHGGFSHFDGVNWTIPGTWEGAPVRASRLAIDVQHGPTTALGCYELFSPAGELLWEGSGSGAVTGDFAPGEYWLTAVLTGVGANVSIVASADLVLA